MVEASLGLDRSTLESGILIMEQYSSQLSFKARPNLAGW
jgi:hypothetical protein